MSDTKTHPCCGRPIEPGVFDHCWGCPNTPTQAAFDGLKQDTAPVLKALGTAKIIAPDEEALARFTAFSDACAKGDNRAAWTWTCNDCGAALPAPDSGHACPAVKLENGEVVPKTFMDRAVAGEWATPDALLDALAWPMNFPGDMPQAEAAGMTQEELDLLHAAACTGFGSYRSRSGGMLAYIVERRREEARLKGLREKSLQNSLLGCNIISERDKEIAVLRALVQEAEWAIEHTYAGGFPVPDECPWCHARGAVGEASETWRHRSDCKAAKVMGWRTV